MKLSEKVLNTTNSKLSKEDQELLDFIVHKNINDFDELAAERNMTVKEFVVYIAYLMIPE